MDRNSDFTSDLTPLSPGDQLSSVLNRPAGDHLVLTDNKGDGTSRDSTMDDGTSLRDSSVLDYKSPDFSRTSYDDDDNENCGIPAEGYLQARDDAGERPRISLRSRVNRRPVQDRPRQKRQTLQDMARPLKQWLYKNKNNPYPTKAEKANLAVGSHMSLTQVSNWFANARRRLKNTVRHPGISWSSRIKMYNSHVAGNAELLSVSSGEESSMGWSDEEHTVTEHEGPDSLKNERLPSPNQDDLKNNHSDVWRENNRNHEDTYSSPFYRPIRDNNTSYVTASDQSRQSFLPNTDVTVGPAKFKHSIMQRYLNDAYQHAFSLQNHQIDQRRRNPSRGSLGSRDYEEMSSSSRSSPINDHVSGTIHDDYTDELEHFVKQRKTSEQESEHEDLYWKEISAAMALTNLARSRHCPSPCF